MLTLRRSMFAVLVAVALIFSAAPASAQITLVTNIGAASTDTNAITTGAADTSGADFLIAAVTRFGTAAAITDSKSNTWTGLTEQTFSAGAVHLQLFYVVTPTVGSGHTFTATGAGGYQAIAVIAFSGVKQTSPFDAESGQNALGLSYFQPGSITPAEAGELFVTSISSGYTTGFSIDLSFAITDQFPGVVGVSDSLALAWYIESGTTARNPTWTHIDAGNVALVMATFKAAAGGGGTGPKPGSRGLLGVGR